MNYIADHDMGQWIPPPLAKAGLALISFFAEPTIHHPPAGWWMVGAVQQLL